jgi:mevalonate kinase
MQQARHLYAHGKLLITGEYLVMEGARALAVPVNRGQHMTIVPVTSGDAALLHWKAHKPGGIWFEASYSLPGLTVVDTTDTRLAQKLVPVLSASQKLAPGFLDGSQSFAVETQLEFNTEYGFGSSSTLVANLAAWAGTDAVALQWKALGGSGYDVACATARGPIFYQITDGKPVSEPVRWLPSFKDHIYFLYLGQKQRSDESIRQFKKKAVFTEKDIRTISSLGEEIVRATTLSHFEALLERHETIMSGILGLPRIYDRYFKDHRGVVKSLGAWGGDFVLITRHESEKDFIYRLKQRGFNTLFSWDELLLK